MLVLGYNLDRQARDRENKNLKIKKKKLKKKTSSLVLLLLLLLLLALNKIRSVQLSSLHIQFSQVVDIIITMPNLISICTVHTVTHYK
jgi:uncharacterized integral membrane protein